MAKTNPNDRNALALQKRQNAKRIPGQFETDDGRVIKLKKKPDLIFIQQASASIGMPTPPTYEIQVGKSTRSYPLDAVVIKQTEDAAEKRRLTRLWNQYQLELGEAMGEQTKRTTGALFYEGTEVDSEMVEQDVKWRKKLKIAGWPIPDDAEELWVFYLQTSLNEDEIKRISTAIVAEAGGASEEQIAAAEEMFLDNVPTDERPGNVEIVGADKVGVE